MSSLRSHSYPRTTSANYILCCLQTNFSSHARLDIPRFSSIVPTNSIMHLLKSLLCTYMSQMYPHADAQYDHTIISVLYCYHNYNIIIINISSCPIATELPSFMISQLSAAARAYFNLGISEESLYSWPPQIHHILHED